MKSITKNKKGGVLLSRFPKKLKYLIPIKSYLKNKLQNENSYY